MLHHNSMLYCWRKALWGLITLFKSSNCISPAWTSSENMVTSQLAICLRKMPIIGLDFFVKTVRLAKEHRLVKDLKQRYNIYGNAYSSTTLGATAMNTIESRNIQTIWASNFKDHGIELFRLPQWSLSLGEELSIPTSSVGGTQVLLSGLRSKSEPCQCGKVWPASEEADQYHLSRWIYNWSASYTS